MFCANVRDALLSMIRLLVLLYTVPSAWDLLLYSFLFYHVATNIIVAMLLSVSLSIVAGMTLLLGRGLGVIFVYDQHASMEVRSTTPTSCNKAEASLTTS